MTDRLHFILKHILTSHLEWFCRRIPLPVRKAVWNSYALADNAPAAKINKQTTNNKNFSYPEQQQSHQCLLSILMFLVTLTFHDCQSHHIHQISQKAVHFFTGSIWNFWLTLNCSSLVYLYVSTKQKALCT